MDMNTQTKVSRLIQELNNNNRNIPTEIWDIEALGYQLLDEFVEDVKSDKVRILRHSREMNPSLFSMLSETKGVRALCKVLIFS